MKELRPCPEDLVAQAGSDGGAARSDGRLGAHLRQCRSCRRELALAQAFKREFEGYAPLEDLGRRVAAAVAKEAARPSPTARRLRARWTLMAAALVVTMAALAAAYSMTLGRREPAPGAPSLPSPSPRATPSSLSTTPLSADRLEEAPVAPSPSLDPSDPARVESVTARRSVPSSRIPGGPVGSEPTARDLFTSANLARRDDEAPRASALYRELQRRYPASVEALVSRVSFGRLLLDRLGDPADALAQFDGYLGQSAHTALAEEALFGRATALSQLGRLDAERETWRTLLARYPSSIYAARARARLGGNK